MAIRSVLDLPQRVGVVEVSLQAVNGQSASPSTDVLAVEEPLEIRLGAAKDGNHSRFTVAVTMRTPGNDRELAAGFLFTEGVIASPADIKRIYRCSPMAPHRDIVHVELRRGPRVDLARLERHSFAASSCGVCGKTSPEAVRQPVRPCSPEKGWRVEPEMIHALPESVRTAQAVFDRTGGLHAAGLFDACGNLLALFEDIGRHNAVDKLVGSRLLADRLPLDRHVLFLSGRAGFELIQKAMMASVSVVASVGAPSSLAVDLARDCGMTLLGFVRNGRFNVYSGAERIRPGH